MTIIECEQGTEQWHQVRAGIPSASNFDKIVTVKGEPSKQRQKYMLQLAGERILGKQEETYQNGAMQRGKELEEEARMFYGIDSNEEIRQVGFCLADGFGCSPDALVGEKGGLEIKCPSLAVHVGYLLDKVLPTEYFQQVQGNLLVTSREWWDFLSYYPGMKSLLIRVYPDEKFLACLKSELLAFCQELDETVRRLS